MRYQAGFAVRLDAPRFDRRRVGRAGAGTALAGEGRIGIKIQFPDDQLRDGIALQNMRLRIHRDHIVVTGIIPTAVRIFHARGLGTLPVDTTRPTAS